MPFVDLDIAVLLQCTGHAWPQLESRHTGPLRAVTSAVRIDLRSARSLANTTAWCGLSACLY